MRISDWSSDVCSSDLQVVDEQLAVEMIDLVMDAGRQQVVDLEHERLAVAVQRLDLDAVGAGNVGEDAGDRQAAFLVFAQLLGAVADNRVDEHQRLDRKSTRLNSRH